MEKICSECRHFQQHYVKVKDGFVKAYCGHCTIPMLRYIPPDNDPCQYFEPVASEAERDK